MSVAFLYDDPAYIGGAEMTMQELAATAPEPLVPLDEADTVVVGNCFLTDPKLVRGKKVIRFIHDHRGPGPIDSEHRIFYSPLQQDRLGLSGALCPAPLSRERFKPPRQARKHRKGTVTIGTFGHPGKGQQLLKEWSEKNDTLVAVYGIGEFIPVGPNIDYRGPLAPELIPTVLWKHKTFIHLPSEIEAYGRGVAEAWAAGCELVVNQNVGCLYWIEKKPEAIDKAAERFWEIVLDA